MIAHSISMAGFDPSVPPSLLLALRAPRATEQQVPSLWRSVGAGTVAGAVGAVVGVGGGNMLVRALARLTRLTLRQESLPHPSCAWREWNRSAHRPRFCQWFCAVPRRRL